MKSNAFGLAARSGAGPSSPWHEPSSDTSGAIDGRCGEAAVIRPRANTGTPGEAVRRVMAGSREAWAVRPLGRAATHLGLGSRSIAARRFRGAPGEPVIRTAAEPSPSPNRPSAPPKRHATSGHWGTARPRQARPTTGQPRRRCADRIRLGIFFLRRKPPTRPTLVECGLFPTMQVARPPILLVRVRCDRRIRSDCDSGRLHDRANEPPYRDHE